MGDVNNQYDFFKEVNLDSNGNIGVIVTGGGGPGSNTIYTADDSLTGNRIVDLNSNTLTFSNGNVLVTGTVDGRDISVDGTKLDGIEPLADVTLNSISAGTNITISPTGVISSSGGSVDTIYSADGTLSGNRTVDLNSNSLTFTGGNINITDNNKLTFGTGGDLEIYHDASSSYIEDKGQGNLILLSDGPDGIILGKGAVASFERMVRALPDAGVELYHNNNLRLLTRNAGVDITGNLEVTGLVDGRNVANDGTKLDTIETGATTDQTLSKGLTLEEPTAGDDITIFRTDVAITVQEVIAVSTGTSPNTTYSISYSVDRSATGTTLVASTSTSGTVNGDVATITNTSIPANSFVWFECSASSGTSVYLSLDVRYTED